MSCRPQVDRAGAYLFIQLFSRTFLQRQLFAISTVQPARTIVSAQSRSIKTGSNKLPFEEVILRVLLLPSSVIKLGIAVWRSVQFPRPTKIRIRHRTFTTYTTIGISNTSTNNENKITLNSSTHTDVYFIVSPTQPKHSLQLQFQYPNVEAQPTRQSIPANAASQAVSAPHRRPSHSSRPRASGSRPAAARTGTLHVASGPCPYCGPRPHSLGLPCMMESTRMR